MYMCTDGVHVLYTYPGSVYVCIHVTHTDNNMIDHLIVRIKEFGSCDHSTSRLTLTL